MSIRGKIGRDDADGDVDYDDDDSDVHDENDEDDLMKMMRMMMMIYGPSVELIDRDDSHEDKVYPFDMMLRMTHENYS